jgi:hypothetical protein
MKHTYTRDTETEPHEYDTTSLEHVTTPDNEQEAAAQTALYRAALKHGGIVPTDRGLVRNNTDDGEFRAVLTVESTHNIKTSVAAELGKEFTNNEVTTGEPADAWDITEAVENITVFEHGTVQDLLDAFAGSLTEFLEEHDAHSRHDNILVTDNERFNSPADKASDATFRLLIDEHDFVFDWMQNQKQFPRDEIEAFLDREPGESGLRNGQIAERLKYAYPGSQDMQLVTVVCDVEVTDD